jgi:hypothetical protein
MSSLSLHRSQDVSRVKTRSIGQGIARLRAGIAQCGGSIAEKDDQLRSAQTTEIVSSARDHLRTR